MADEHDVTASGDEALGLAMNLGHQRAGRVEILEPAIPRLGGNGLGHAVRGEDDGRVVGNLVQLLDKTAPFAFRLSTTNLLWTISCRT